MDHYIYFSTESACNDQWTVCFCVMTAGNVNGSLPVTASTQVSSHAVGLPQQDTSNNHLKKKRHEQQHLLQSWAKMPSEIPNPYNIPAHHTAQKGLTSI
jgi:hypothetical protein